MPKKFFLVIEGLDGAGKSTLARALAAHYTSQWGVERVLATCEPHPEACAGGFIRQMLQHQVPFHARTLALAFAANRLDHRERFIAPFLAQPGHRLVVCDRYYLSSLVYQVQAPVTFADVLTYNQAAPQPDLTLFLQVSDAVCQQRMQQRGQAPELFEQQLAATRARYQDAIAYLQKRGERIEIIAADGDAASVFQAAQPVITELLATG
jgi:dTMP kinase